MRSLGWLIGLGAVNGLALEDRGALRLFEQIHAAPESWQEVGKPALDTKLTLSVTLTAANPRLLERTLYDISNPEHERYGKHLSQREVKSIIKPAENTRKVVLDWLKSSGVTIRSAVGEKVEFTTTVANADAMLGGDFRIFERTSNPADRKIRTLNVMMPQNILEHVRLVHPTTYFDQIQPLRSIIHTVINMTDASAELADPDASCSRVITPTCLEQLYDVKGVEIKDPKSAGILGVPGFLGQIARTRDLELFAKNIPSRAKGAALTFTASELNGRSMETVPIE